MQRSTSALTLLSAASLTCGLVLTPAVPALAHEEHGTASASDTTSNQRTRRIDGENTVAGVHANLVDLSLRDGALTLGSRASTHDGEGIYELFSTCQILTPPAALWLQAMNLLPPKAPLSGIFRTPAPAGFFTPASGLIISPATR